jgi:phosphohistidine swiveling domain-containing protein
MLRVVPGSRAGYGRNCCFVTVLAEMAAEPRGPRLAVFKVSYVAADGAEHQVPLAEAAPVPFEQAMPVRRFTAHQGQRHLSGLWWSATTGGHVGFESWLERDHLMALDFDPGMTGIASQPFWLQWTGRGGVRVSHAPDYFARRADGSAVVVDCRPAERRKPAEGLRVAGRPGVPGMAPGPLVACRPHETGASDCRGAIVLVDRPVPALAPLLFGARGVISRAGAAGSHLAEVARGLGVPMVVSGHPETVTGPGPAPGAWFATINGGTGEVVLTQSRMSDCQPPA